MEIVSSCNHRYTPDTQRAREKERENSLSAFIDSSVPLGKVRGTSVLADYDRSWKIRVFFPPLADLSLTPVAQQLRIRETVLPADITVRFSDAAVPRLETKIRISSHDSSLQGWTDFSAKFSFRDLRR